MPVQNYSVLKGQPKAGEVVTGASTHYQITVATQAGASFTAALNIESVDGSEVLYAIVQPFAYPDEAALEVLSDGITPVASEPGGFALDFVRETIDGRQMIRRSQMTLLPKASAGRLEARALENAVIALLNEAIADGGSEVYAFGSAFADSGVVDGIHDLHMNQGNPIGNHGSDNGVWQDGVVMLHLPSRGAAAAGWVAIFVAFQTQSWKTDAAGNPAEKTDGRSVLADGNIDA